MAIITPAMFELHEGMGMVLPTHAYRYADIALRAEGIDPLKAFEDVETQRMHYVIARDYARKERDNDARAYGGIVIDLVSDQCLTKTTEILRSEGIV